MIAIVDYGAGNLASVGGALGHLNIAYQVTAEKEILQQAKGIILPGVGAFRHAMTQLSALDLVETLKEEAVKKPFLGICLGLQVLFDVGEEFGDTPGLGILPGRVRPLRSGELKTPAIGWNTVSHHRPCALSEGIDEGSWVYYVHSYCVETSSSLIALATEYGEVYPAMVHGRDVVYGCQFHPEKSGRVGLRILENFGRIVDDYTTGH